VNLADTQWILVITAFLLGAGLGALAYHLMNSNVAHGIKIRHQLTERELEVNQLREGLNDHFSRTADGLAGMSKQLKEMQDQIRLDADHLCNDEGVIKRLTNQAEADPPIPSDQPGEKSQAKAEVTPPRDYASRTTEDRGTLSEEFGLKPEVFEPPRN